MVNNIDLYEKKFRFLSKDTKKYVENLTSYIEELIKNGRFVEARYYFKELNYLKPHHHKTIRIGYDISIYTFDDCGVEKFDFLVHKFDFKKYEINLFQLKYYYSRNNIRNIEIKSLEMLRDKLNGESLGYVYEVGLVTESYNIVSKLVKYFHKNKMVFKNHAEIRIRKILIKKLIDSIVLVKK